MTKPFMLLLVSEDEIDPQVLCFETKTEREAFERGYHKGANLYGAESAYGVNAEEIDDATFWDWLRPNFQEECRAILESYLTRQADLPKRA